MDASDDEDDLEIDGQTNHVDGKKWDVYSLSIVFAYVFTGKEVYPGLTNPRIFRGVPKGKRPDTTGVDEGTVNLMKRMWTKRHTQRPTMVQVLEELQRVQAVVCGDNADYTEDVHDDKSSSSGEEDETMGDLTEEQKKALKDMGGDDAAEGEEDDKSWHADLGKGEKPEHNIDEEPGRRNADRNKTIEENVTKAQDPAAHPDFGAR